MEADPYLVEAITVDVSNRTRLHVTVLILADDRDRGKSGIENHSAPISDEIGIRIRSEIGINDVLAGRPSEAALERKNLLDPLARRNLRALADGRANPLKSPGIWSAPLGRAARFARRKSRCGDQEIGFGYLETAQRLSHRQQQVRIARPVVLGA